MPIPLGAITFLLSLAAIILAPAAAVAGETVHVENASRPTRCAEEDNVYVKLSRLRIARFSITAAHPAYLPRLAQDSMAPDFSDCGPAHDPSYSFTPRDVVLYEDSDYRLMGHTLASFWRPEIVPFAVGDRTTLGLQLVQLFRKVGGQWIEFLVLYPSDGYWRLKPLPPERFVETGYGSSFLVGPIKEDGRPYVPIKSIRFDPKDIAFHLAFAEGRGMVRVKALTRDEARLDITLDPAAESGPFVALRSMFVSTEKADMAEVRADAAPAQPILSFREVEVARITFFRSLPSRHNASAPDLTFGDFER